MPTSLHKIGLPFLLSSLLCFGAACGGGQHGDTLPEAERYPPLPTTPLAALPGNAALVTHLDMGRARDTEPLRLLDQVRQHSCLGPRGLESLWGSTDGAALALGLGEDGAGWALVLAGENPQALDPMPLLQQLASAFPSWGRTVRGQRVGRLDGRTLGPITLARIGPKLLLMVSAEHFAAVAKAYDDPQRAMFAPDPSLQVEPGMVELWDRRGQLLRPVLAVLPDGLRGLLQAAPFALSVVVGPAGLQAQARTQLNDERRAMQLTSGLSNHLRSSAWMFGLVGLPPLHERIKGLHNDAIVEFHVNMTSSEVSKLLSRLQSHLESAAEGLCQGAQHLSGGGL